MKLTYNDNEDLTNNFYIFKTLNICTLGCLLRFSISILYVLKKIIKILNILEDKIKYYKNLIKYFV